MDLGQCKVFVDKRGRDNNEKYFIYYLVLIKTRRFLVNDTTGYCGHRQRENFADDTKVNYI